MTQEYFSRRDFIKGGVASLGGLVSAGVRIKEARAMEFNDNEAGNNVDYNVEELKTGILVPDILEDNTSFKKTLFDISKSIKEKIIPQVNLDRGLDPFEDHFTVKSDGLIIKPGAPFEVLARFEDVSGRKGKMLAGFDQVRQELFPLPMILNTEPSIGLRDIPATPSAPTPAPYGLATSQEALSDNLDKMEEAGSFIGVNWVTSGGESSVTPGTREFVLGEQMAKVNNPNPMGSAIFEWKLIGYFNENKARGGVTILVGNQTQSSSVLS